MVGVEGREDVLDEELVEVVATEVGVAVAGFHLDDAALGDDDRDVEGAAAEVIDEEIFIGGFLCSVGEGGGGRLVEDALDVEAGEFSGGASGEALALVKKGGDGDDGGGEGAAEGGFCAPLEFAEDEGGNFLRAVVLGAKWQADVFAHVALDGEKGGVLGGDGLIPRGSADDEAAGGIQADAGRDRGAALDV